MYSILAVGIVLCVAFSSSNCDETPSTVYVAIPIPAAVIRGAKRPGKRSAGEEDTGSYYRLTRRDANPNNWDAGKIGPSAGKGSVIPFPRVGKRSAVDQVENFIRLPAQDSSKRKKKNLVRRSPHPIPHQGVSKRSAATFEEGFGISRRDASPNKWDAGDIGPSAGKGSVIPFPRVGRRSPMDVEEVFVISRRDASPNKWDAGDIGPSAGKGSVIPFPRVGKRSAVDHVQNFIRLPAQDSSKKKKKN